MGDLRSIAWSLALLVALAPAAMAAPIADDARELATPIEPGHHSGILLRPFDVKDFFTFEAPAGAVLQMDFASSGDARMILYDPSGDAYAAWTGNGVATSKALAAGGTWTLEVRTGTLPTAGELLGHSDRASYYDFAFGLVEGARVATSVAHAEWHVFELAPATSGWVEGGAALQLPRHLTKPEALMLAVQVGGANAIASSSAWIGSDVRVGAPVDLNVEGATVTLEQVGDFWLLNWRHVSASAPMRIVMYSVGMPVKSTVHFWSAVPIATAAASGDDTVQWTAHGGGGIQAPGVALRSGDELSLDVDHHFFGVFTTGGGDGWYDTPSGARVAMGSANPSDPLVGVGAGSWRFHVAAHHALAHEAAGYHLAGVLVAPLGVYG